MAIIVLDHAAISVAASSNNCSNSTNREVRILGNCFVIVVLILRCWLKQANVAHKTSDCLTRDETGLEAREELHAAHCGKLLHAHTLDALPTLPATHRGSAVAAVAHAFAHSFAGQFTATGDACKGAQILTPAIDNFRGVARNGDIFRQQQREMSKLALMSRKLRLEDTRLAGSTESRLKQRTCGSAVRADTEYLLVGWESWESRQDRAGTGLVVRNSKGAGLVGQERAGPGRSSCELTNQ